MCAIGPAPGRRCSPVSASSICSRSDCPSGSGRRRPRAYARRRAAAKDDPLQAEVSTVGAYRRVRIATPELVLLPPTSGRVVDVAIGYCFFLVITDLGKLLVFGFNDKGAAPFLPPGLGPWPHRRAEPVVGPAAAERHAPVPWKPSQVSWV